MVHAAGLSQYFSEDDNSSENLIDQNSPEHISAWYCLFLVEAHKFTYGVFNGSLGQGPSGFLYFLVFLRMIFFLLEFSMSALIVPVLNSLCWIELFFEYSLWAIHDLFIIILKFYSNMVIYFQQKRISVTL